MPGEAKLFVFQFPKESPLINPSPFCIKLMAFYKIANLPHVVKYNTNAISKNPKKKLPFIERDGKIIGDSRLIVDMYRKEGIDLDAHLTPYQKAISTAIQRTLEESTVWYGLRVRWISNLDVIIKTQFAGLPFYLVWLPYYIQRTMKNNLYAQGTGRLTEQEQYTLAIQDVDAIETILKSSKTTYFHDSQSPTMVDIIAFSFTFALISVPVKDPLIDYFLKNCPSLLKLNAKMLETYFPKEYPHFANLFK